MFVNEMIQTETTQTDDGILAHGAAHGPLPSAAPGSGGDRTMPADMAVGWDRALLKDALTWWRTTYAEAVPCRQAIDPLTMPRPLLPRVALLDRDGDRWRFRLAGTWLCDACGGELRGRYWYGGVAKDDLAPLDRALRAVTDGGRPDVARHDLEHARLGPMAAWTAVFPLSGDGSVVDGLLIVVDTEHHQDQF